MLKPAKLHEDELNRVYQQNMLDDRFKWYHMEYANTTLTIEDSFYSRIQFVSINTKGTVSGFFAATVSRPDNFIDAIYCINFDEENKALFAKDLITFLKYLAYDRKFPKISWGVVVGNPIEKAYDKLCKKHGGRIVGIRKYDRLIDNEYHDFKMYEWINDYYECTQCDYKTKKEEEVLCWKCGLGEMVYVNPLKR